MANYELGRIGLNLRGSYDAAMTYQRLDTVTYNGSSYVALENCSGILPSDTERWMMLAQRAQGLGVQAGDVITLPMNMPVGAGYISGAGCNIHFTIPLGTELSNVSMVSLSGTIVIRGAKGYITQATYDAPMNIQDSSYTTTVSIVDHKMGVISVYIQKSTAFGNYTNNTPLSVASGATPLVLTFA